MGALTERELTRLTFLMTSIVATPALADRFFDSVRKQPDAFEAVIKDVQRRIHAAAKGKTPTRETLRTVAGELVADAEVEKKTAGRLLAAALETAPER